MITVALDRETVDEAALVEGLAEVFAEQIAAWREAGRVGVPVLALGDTIAVRRGRCLSCGIPAMAWRCDECLEAVEFALELADLEGEPLVPPPPIINPVVLAIEDAAEERDMWRRDG